jgi:hypothetical protein
VLPLFGDGRKGTLGAFLDWLRQFDSEVNRQILKSPLKAGFLIFGRTRRIRTADLYHVKASVTRRYTDSGYVEYTLTTRLTPARPVNTAIKSSENLGVFYADMAS